MSQSSYRQNKRVLFRVVDDEAIILDLEAGEYYGLNAVATRVWQLLGADESVESVLQTLLGEYDVEAEQLRSDLTQLIADMVSVGLLLQTSAQEYSIGKKNPVEASP